ncbi:MutS protein msh4 [Coemansia interrupta]|uniref:MutS protein msh4 n=1 Tax=Coemansia interrupta TaxID=1126814 RepID=A0A9W8LNQ3_9FUNG|nr:MutS protein msh4 [Coemansia interrupta]
MSRNHFAATSRCEVIDLTLVDSDDDEDDHVYRPPSTVKRAKLESQSGLSAEVASVINDTGSVDEEISICAPTSAFTDISRAPQVLMTLTEGRGVASEIAYCLFDMSSTKCILSQYADGPSYSHTIYAVVTNRPQLIIMPTAMAAGKSKAMQSIRRYIPWMQFASMERRAFNDRDGIGVSNEKALPTQIHTLEHTLHLKRYAYAALNAMFCYIERELNLTFANGSVSIECRQIDGTMLIDPGAWKDLDLDTFLQDSADWSLYRAINHTVTKMGGRLLRSNMLQPLADITTIYARQKAVGVLLESEECFFNLSALLSTVPDIDAVITMIVRMPVVVDARQASTVIGNVLSTKHILQVTAKIAAVFGGLSMQSSLLQEIVSVLTDARITALLDMIHEVVRENVTLETSAQMKRSQRCYAVKDGVDGFLDVSRAIFDKVTKEVVDLVEEVSSVHIPVKAVYKPSIGYTMTTRRNLYEDTLPDEFVNTVVRKNTLSFTTFDLIKLNNRLSSVVTEISLLTEKAIQRVSNTILENIALLYRVSEAIALLDMLLSFAHHCTLYECVVPMFSDSIKVKQSRHPILEAIGGKDVVPNDIDTTSANFTVVSGPNMGGKSTYLRQIVYTVIMAQIGSYVQAKSATLKVFDRLFVRTNNNDSISNGESSFQREMHDMAYILKNNNRHSLVVVDELGRSTATSEGKAICRAICEDFLENSGQTTVFLTTHFLDLPHILGKQGNCMRVVLSPSNLECDAESTEEGQKPTTTRQRFRAKIGAQTDPLYGISLAKTMLIPSDIIDVASEVAEELMRSDTGNMH